jgi:hypothetical protein
MVILQMTDDFYTHFTFMQMIFMAMLQMTDDFYTHFTDDFYTTDDR